jgi:hypothetical protein
VLNGTVLDAILIYQPSLASAVVAVKAILICHLLFALPIILTPIMTLFERTVLKNHVPASRTIPMAALRFGIMLVLTLIALLLPDFLPFMSIISDISVVSVIYIFPPIFYWKICLIHWPSGPRKVLMSCFMVFIVLFGMAGSALGLRVAIPALISAIKTGGGFFNNFMTFGCGNSTQY